MWLACNRRSASGRLASNRCRPNPGADEAARHRVCGATASDRLFPPRRWRWGFPRRLGASFRWREGSNETLSSRFAAVRIRPASRDWKSFGASSAGMASHRMARGRKRADEILAFDPARRHPSRRSRRHGQIALAHRARLRGIEKRTRPRPFRRAKLARIPSPRRALHRRLWFPDPRTSGDSPLRPPAAPNVSPIHRVPNPEAPPIRPERHVENSIATIRRQLTIALARTLMRCPCCQALPPRQSDPGSSL